MIFYNSIDLLSSKNYTLKKKVNYKCYCYDVK